MRSPDGLFFAPGLRFKDLSLGNAHSLADALRARANAWFLEPARSIAEASPFASGIIAVCFIDAAAQFAGVTLVQWLRETVPKTAERDPRRGNRTIADSFQEDVRHGLVHHARLSRGAEFSLVLEQPMAVVDSVLIVNPLMLLDAVEAKWRAFLDGITLKPHLHQTAAGQIGRVFRADFQADKDWSEPSMAGDGSG